MQSCQNSSLNANIVNDNYSSNRNIFNVLRQCLGLSRTEMAKRCGVSSVYLYELESGKKVNPSIDILTRIANSSGISLQTLQFFVSLDAKVEFNYSLYLIQALEVHAKRSYYETIK